jgi:HNH endonuclease/AP2 domain
MAPSAMAALLFLETCVMAELTFERLRQVLDYDPQTGIFTWRQRPNASRLGKVWNTRYAGKEAGCIDKDRGYRILAIDNKSYWAHRLVFLYVFGQWPPNQVDHLDANPSNNKLANLRLATGSQNQANQRRPINNTSGFKGVSSYKGKWQAQISYHSKTIRLGIFSTPDAAHAAYVEAAIKYYGEFARSA